MGGLGGQGPPGLGTQSCSPRRGWAPLLPHSPLLLSPSPRNGRFLAPSPARPAWQGEQQPPSPQASLTTPEGRGVPFPKQLRAAPSPQALHLGAAHPPQAVPTVGVGPAQALASSPTHPRGVSPPSLGKHRWAGAGARVGGASGVSNQETKLKGRTQPQSSWSHAEGLAAPQAS